MAAPIHSGSRAKTENVATGTRVTAIEQEWRAAEAVDRREARERTRAVLARVLPAGVMAALLPAILAVTPGFAMTDTLAAVVASAIAAGAAIGIVPLADRLARGLPNAGAGERLVVVAALLSAGAAAVHFAVAKPHFDEYTLFGVFFVGSGIAQLVWPIWALLRRWRPLFLLAAIGNAAIVALWAVSRIWGLPLGPEPWEPEPIGFGDVITAAFELLLVVACIALLRRGRGPGLSRAHVPALALCITVLTALSFLSVLGVGSSFLTPTE